MSRPGPMVTLLLSVLAIQYAAGNARAQQRPQDYDVAIHKRLVATGPLSVGHNAVFELAPYNNGPAAIGGGTVVVVVDTLPSNFTAPISATGIGWSCTVAGQIVTCVYSGSSVAAHNSFAGISIVAVVRSEGGYRNCAEIAPRPRGDMPNAAGVTSIKDVNPRDNQSCIEGDIKPGGAGTDGYDVGIRKTSEGDVFAAGQTATFTLNSYNNGPSPVGAATGVTVTDTLPDNFTAPITAAGMGPGWNCVVAGNVVTCVYTGVAVGAHQSLPGIKITARAAREGEYNNCAEIDMKPRIFTAVDRPIHDTSLKDNKSCIGGKVTGNGGGRDFDVGISKTGPATPPAVGQAATFTLNPFNNGPSTVNPAQGATVTDTVPDFFGAPISASGSGWTCTVTGNVVSCVYSGGAVNAHQSFPSITVNATARRQGEYNNCAEIELRPRGGPRSLDIVTPAGGVIKDTQPKDNKGCVPGRVVSGKPTNNVSIRKLGGGAVAAGSQITFTFDVFNLGPDPVGPIAIVDTLPAGLTAVSAPTGSPWSCTLSGNVLTCVYSGGNVALNAHFPVVNFSATANTAGSFSNCAKVTINGTTDTDMQDNRDCRDYSVTAVVKNGTLTVVKDATPNSAQDFVFMAFNATSGAINPFTLDDDAGAAGADNTYLNSKTFTLPAASYSIKENAVTGWSLSSITCLPAGSATIDMSLGAFTVNLTAGANVTCTFTNKGQTPAGTASITIIKDASPDDPQDFQFTATGNGVHNFSLDDDPSDNTLPNRITFNNLMPGNYDFTELATSGWLSGGTGNGGGINCDDTPHPTRSNFSSTPSTLHIGLVAGDSVFCTVINTKQAPTGFGTVTIIKDAVPNDPQDFFFLFGNSGGSFVLDDDGVDNNPYFNHTTLPGLAAGSWTFTENAVSGWTLSGIVCTPSAGTTPSLANRNVTINVTAGSSFACTFTNTKQATGTASLTIIKDAVPDNAQDFHFTTSGPGLTGFSLDDDPTDSALPNSKTFTGLATGVQFTVTEDAVPGWTVPSLQCIPDIIGTSTTYTDQLNRTFTVSMAPGVHMTCTFKNVQ